MRRFFLSLTILALCVPVAGAPAPMTVVDYATMPVPSSPRLSPDGTRVVFVLRRADLEQSVYDTDLWLVNADGSNLISLAHSRRSETMPRWSPDGRRIAFLSTRGGSNQVWAIDPDGGEAAPLTSHETSIEAFAWSPDGSRIAFLARQPEDDQRRARSRERDDAFEVGSYARHQHLTILDLESGETMLVPTGPGSVLEFDWSPDGGGFVISRAPGTGLAERFDSDLFLVRGNDLAPLVAQPGPDIEPRFSPDGAWVAYSTGRGRMDWSADHHLAVVSVSNGSSADRTASYQRHIETSFWDDDSGDLYFEGPWNLQRRLYRVRGTSVEPLSDLGGYASDAHFVPSLDRVAFIHETLTAPPEVWISPINRFAPKALTSVNAALRERALAPTRILRWKNPEDGLQIEGILSLPLDYEPGQRVPLLLFVHGGPASYFTEEFLGYFHHVYPVHVFAARGYAVLRPNIRGSGAYGEPFRQANRKDWGGADFRDAMAGVDLLVREGIADPERLGIMGWSYGGFLSAWAITQTDRFRAASIGAAIVDLSAMEGTSDIPGYIASFFEALPWTDDALMRSRSPIAHIARAKTPALIQHGEADQRVPLSQGQMLYRALVDLGVPVTMVTYPRSAHTAREPKLRIDVMERNLWWFDRWIRGDERSFRDWQRQESPR